VILGLWGSQLSDAVALIGYAALFIPWLLVVFGSDEPELLWIIVTAVGMRLSFLPSPPIFSDDIYRYLWDGHVAWAGINPYLYAPASTALDGLKEVWFWSKINHPDVPTVYPPGAQFLFLVNGLFGGSLVSWRLILMVSEGLCLLAVWRCLADTEVVSFKRFATYVSLCPLVVVESYWSGHLDILAWMPLIAGLGIYWFGKTKKDLVIAGLLVGASIAVKFLGLLSLPFILFYPTDKWSVGDRLIPIAISIAMLGGSYLPYLSAGSDLFAGFSTFAAKWRSNDGGFRLLYSAFYPAVDYLVAGRVLRLELSAFPDWLVGARAAPISLAVNQLTGWLAKGLSAIAVFAAILYAVSQRTGFFGGQEYTFATLFWFAPVLHPWYIGWLIPLGAFDRSRLTAVFSCVVLFGYLAWLSSRSGGPWAVPIWALALEYGAVLAVTIYIRTAREKF
jgi:hypothetical protein